MMDDYKWTALEGNPLPIKATIIHDDDGVLMYICSKCNTNFNNFHENTDDDIYCYTCKAYTKDIDYNG